MLCYGFFKPLNRLLNITTIHNFWTFNLQFSLRKVHGCLNKLLNALSTHSHRWNNWNAEEIRKLSMINLQTDLCRVID